ncbi:hypothetical protein LTS17_005303 [Exophiala oligosperma]
MASSTESPSNLPIVHRHITTHDDAGKAIVYSSEAGQWQAMRNNTVALDLVYTTSTFPAQLNGEVDIKAHEARVEGGGTGLVVPGGSVCRLVDFGPDNNPMMHRTKSLDYGVVLEGEVEMILDSGEVRKMKRGDIAIQRGTMHAWKNPSKTEWARMMFVLLDCEPVQVGGAVFQEKLAAEQHEIPASGK